MSYAVTGTQDIQGSFQVVHLGGWMVTEEIQLPGTEQSKYERGSNTQQSSTTH